MTQLTLYSRTGCHLCEDMLQQLQRLQTELAFELDVVDIDDDAGLVERYGSRVPVLQNRAGFICEYFLDEQALRDTLSTRE